MATYYEGGEKFLAEGDVSLPEYKRLKQLLYLNKLVLFGIPLVIIAVLAMNGKSVPVLAVCLVCLFWLAGSFFSQGSEELYRSDKSKAEKSEVSIFRDSFEIKGEALTFKGYWSEAGACLEDKQFFIIRGCPEKELVFIRKLPGQEERMSAFFRETFAKKYHKSGIFCGFFK